MFRLSALLLTACFLAFGLRAVARADFFSTTPGPLSQAHAALDSKDKCVECHVDGRKVARDKCVACHAPIAERQAQNKGLHAGPKALGRPCELCHVEHKGRSKDLMGWSGFGGKDHFDHNALTTFMLEGKHKEVACAKCHTQKTPSGTTTFLKAATTCIGCHANPHGDTREPLKRCERCHDAKSWKQVDKPLFDHDKDSRYPLERKHVAAKCIACHAKGGNQPPSVKAPAQRLDAQGYQKLTFRWAAWGFDCTPCHDNVHGASLFGQKSCKLCHSAKVDWPQISFDHGRRTHFPLEGAHEKKATCDSCHKKEERKAPDRACISCHTDVHKNRFAEYGGSGKTDCGTCHGASQWKPDLKFDHNRLTRFSLSGLHASATCRSCHRGKGPTEWEHLEKLVTKVAGSRVVATDCMGCHHHENVHQKQYANDRCLECHKMAGVRDTKPRAVNEFHGPSSAFPLVEGHRGVECAKCHPGNVFTNAPKQCGPTCHPDDLHKGTLGDKCSSCHTGGTWEARNFEHDRDTKWPLVGNHKDVLCDSCHPRRDFAANRGKGRTCYSCHKKDDPHDGELGTHCETCHIPDGSLLFDHNDPKLSSWRLEGKHEGVRCGDCHKSIHFKPTPTDCGACHGEPAVHKGQLGTLCGRCHDATDWKNIHVKHDVPGIKFGGAHDRVTCYKCHTQGRLLEGTGPLCITCHKNDDIHNNGLGPRCGECHTQNAWAGARFDHNKVGCNITGVHRMLPCAECHVGGNFAALAPNCASCHRKDAIRGASQPGAPPNHASLTTCTTCHNSNYFKLPGGMLRGSGRESVCQ